MPVERRALGRVLVTGGAGFLGARLVEALRGQGTDVVASDLVGGGGEAAPFAICDITNSTAVATLVARVEPDTIFHCGAVSGPMVMADRPLDIWRINALGTAHVLEAARCHDVGRVVVCSTSEVYGSRNRGIVDEQTRPEPDNVYGASKAAAEQAVIGYRREHALDAAAIRLSWIYGPGRRTPTQLECLLRAGIAGRSAILKGRPEDVTHYLFLDDAVRGLLCAATTRRTEWAICNVTAGKGSTLARTVDAARAILPDLQVEFAEGEPATSGPAGFDGTRAATSLGYRPETDFDTGIRRTVEALRLSSKANCR